MNEHCNATVNRYWRGRHSWLLAIALLAAFPAAASAVPIGTGINYQAVLNQNGAPVNGLADFQFKLFDAATGGMQIGMSQTSLNILVSNGLYMASLDFGATVYGQDARWLEVAVRFPAGIGSYVMLSPRQRVTPTPVSLNLRGFNVDDSGNVDIGGILKVGNGIFISGGPPDSIGSDTGRIDFVPVAPAMALDVVVDRNLGTGFPPLPAGMDLPETRLHARRNNLIDWPFIPATGSGLPLWEEEIVGEDTTTWLGLYYEGNGDGPAGTGAGITLAKSYEDQNGNDAVNKWSVFYRDANECLETTFGANLAAPYNPTVQQLMSRIAPNGNTLLCPVSGNLGVGPMIAAGLAPQAPLHVYLEGGQFDPVAIFQKQSDLGTNYAVQIHGQRIETFDMDGGADPALRLNTTSSGDVTIAGGGGNVLINGGGNIGIGTDAPNSAITIFTLDNTRPAMHVSSSRDITMPDGDNLQIGHWNEGTSTFTERMRITSAGDVGIKRIPGVNDLEVEGTASKTTAGAWGANSDARIKTDVRTVGDALATLDRVRLVSFRYTDEYRAAHPDIEGRRYLNVIAQEFAEVFPNDVKGSGEKLPDGSEILQVDPYPLTIYAAAAVQELHVQLRELRAEKDARIAELTARLDRLEATLNLNLCIDKEGGR